MLYFSFPFRNRDAMYKRVQLGPKTDSNPSSAGMLPSDSFLKNHVANLCKAVRKNRTDK